MSDNGIFITVSVIAAALEITEKETGIVILVHICLTDILFVFFIVVII